MARLARHASIAGYGAPLKEIAFDAVAVPRAALARRSVDFMAKFWT